ncbi:reverse transcriptase domain-containing protein [Tanacetum coccineum]
MVTPAGKRDPNKYCEFHADTGHSTDECMQLRKQIDEMIKAAKQKVTQSFSPETTISFPPLGDEDETEGPMIIEADTGGHFMHRMSPSQHNGIIGRPGIRKIRAIPSTAHGMLKFPVEGGTVTLRSSRIIPMECAMISGPSTRPPEAGKILEVKIAKEMNSRGHGTFEEVEKLVDAGIMKEVHYHNWLSNPVMVKKHDGSWRMCVDFKDLNKACPQDGYPLPEIDWKVESLCGYPFKCFLDAYKGYHQIKMAKEDEEKTAFITNQGIFCYSKMSFGLKNAGATYQRLVDKAFQRQIGRNLEAKDCNQRANISRFYCGTTRGRVSGRAQRLNQRTTGAMTLFTDGTFEATNNEAEYEALIAGLRIAEQMGVKNLQAYVDSRLVANQVYGSYVGPNNQHDPIFEQSTNARKKLQGIFQQASTTEAKTRKADA